MDLILHRMIDLMKKKCSAQELVLKVGVTCTRYVSLPNARPWVIHAYRNIRGRGLHVDEDVNDSVPTDEIDESWSNPSQERESSYSYTEPVEKATNLECPKDDRITINQDANGSSVNQSTEGQSQKRRKIDPGKEKEPKDEKQNAPSDIVNSDIRMGSKRKLSDQPSDAEKNTEIKKRKKSESITESDTKIAEETSETKTKLEDTANYLTTSEGDKNSKGSNKDNEVNESNQEKVQEKRLRIRKRKFSEDEEQKTKNSVPAVSTYDKVRLVIQPWRKPEGGINKAILKMMLESVMLYLMMNPGSPEDVLANRYAPYLQPMIIRNIVDVLEDIGCVHRKFIIKSKPSLFSKPSLPTIGGEEEEDSTVLIIPVEDCVIKLGQFGQEVFPHAKWPENTLPSEKSKHDGIK